MVGYCIGRFGLFGVTPLTGKLAYCSPAESSHQTRVRYSVPCLATREPSERSIGKPPQVISVAS